MVSGEKPTTSETVNKDTYFDVASMGKVLVTSTLVLHAVSEGRIALDDTGYCQSNYSRQNFGLRERCG